MSYAAAGPPEGTILPDVRVRILCLARHSQAVLKESYPFYLANEPARPNVDLQVTDKYTGDVATRVALADAETIDQAIAAAADATDPMRRMRPYERQAVLNHCVARFTERSEDLAMSLCVEAGKPIRAPLDPSMVALLAAR